MPTPAFPPNTLDDAGDPIWISGLAGAEPNHAVHVVKGIEPAEALKRLGAAPGSFRACVLPDRKPDEWTSLPGAALGIEPGTSAALLAGRIGAWTFVYDDAMVTSSDDTGPLSAGGRSAATSTFSINADASVTYAVDGKRLVEINVDDLDLEADLPGLPAELRAAFDAAGVFGAEEADYAIGMRVVCALAGFTFTMADLRRIPLLATEFG
ncbi:hypothetical protein [Amycolatopsis jejuensis]|uniref:hypothetical protein n=1 Tax=Amycolatopsis jejuensis TaxID=330084 RepID=UPI000527A277|nr:hypothetical protein [Amycolatopsis jejuensis]